jgi:hypothetical protein
MVKEDLKSKYLEGKLSAATSKLTGSLKEKLGYIDSWRWKFCRARCGL